MDVIRRTTLVSWTALAVGAFSLALVVVGLVQGRSPAQEEQERHDAAQRLESVERALARLASRVDGMPERIAKLESADAAAPAVAALDEEAVRRIVMSQVAEAGDRGRGDRKVVPVELGDVPEAVAAKVAQLAPGVEVTETQRRIERGEVHYRLKGVLDGREYDYRIDPLGNVIKAGMPVEQAPEAVVGAARARLPGLTITEVNRKARDDAEFFEVEGTVDGARYELRITLDGQVVELEGPKKDNGDRRGPPQRGRGRDAEERGPGGPPGDRNADGAPVF